MSDEQLNLDAPEEQEANRVEQRIRNLAADKAKLSADKAEAEKAKAEAEAARQAALKEAEFYKNFNTQVSKNPAAAEYQDKILEKVKAGYDLEDATISILAREGKLSAPPAPKSSPAGGSATTTLTDTGNKTIGEMTQAERRAALEEAVRRGDIGLN
jgi:uncharacterized membrane protein YqiK